MKKKQQAVLYQVYIHPHETFPEYMEQGSMYSDRLVWVFFFFSKTETDNFWGKFINK